LYLGETRTSTSPKTSERSSPVHRHVDDVAVLDAEALGVLRCHVDVAPSADHAL